jgi:ABC-2 type transport system ATP-binding protein
MEPVIVLDDLTVIAEGDTLLANVSAKVAAGTIVGLLGPSGSGKTTLIRAILGLRKASTGSVEVLGQPAGARKLKSSVGYVTQAPSVYPDLTVYENIRYFASLLGVGRALVSEVIHEVELDDQAGQLVERLSGGQKTRVLLAVALLGRPKLLLLDEPTVGLDPVLRKKLWAKFKTLAAAGTTILISSHVMDEAEQCDALMFIRGGTLLICDEREAVLRKTHTTTMEAAFLKLAGTEAV